ncbi:MAG: hypothetical protein ABJN65_07795 [Parasphingorhabdus sp.]
MRRLLSLPILAASMAIANPVIAAEQVPESEMIEKLNDPEFQDNLTSMMSGFMGAMMALPIGEFAHSIENAIPETMRDDRDFSDINRDATVGDLARRDNPDFDRNIESKMRQSTAMMGFMASEFGALLPELRALGERMKERMERLD